MFDYVRFPTDGDLSAAVFAGKRKEHKTVTIGKFVEYARSRLEPLGARVSAAVFGLTATREMGIGQRPRRLAPHLDVMYPMVYPSHFGAGEYSLDDPNAVPGVTVARALRDFRRELRGYDTLLVPWLQDFSLGTRLHSRGRAAQVLAARDAQSRRLPPLEPDRRVQDGRARRILVAEPSSTAMPTGPVRGCGKCGKMNFPQIAGNRSRTGLHCPPGPSRLPLAPSTERE